MQDLCFNEICKFAVANTFLVVILLSGMQQDIFTK